MAPAAWIDLLDPSEEELRDRAPWPLHASTVELLLSSEENRRPRFQNVGEYVLGFFLVPVLVPTEDRLYEQELGLLVAEEAVLLVRKTPRDGPPFDAGALTPPREGDSAGLVAFRVVDAVAEEYLDLIDGMDEEVEELEDNIEDWPTEQVRRRIADIRHDMLHVRRRLAPTRDAVREVVDGRIELAKVELFPREIELLFGNVYDKFLRAIEGLEFSRDLLTSARDHLQARIANDQNEVMKRLTAIASILLLPTFIVGLYGQNFVDIPELGWHYGYAYAWGVIVAITVAQLVWFRRKGWL